MPTLADVYRAINALQADGVVQNYAVGGGMAALFYAETTRTYDIDVFTALEQHGLLVDLSGIYNWAGERGFEARDEYLMMHGVPVRVMKPEYLVALYVETGGEKRIGRALDLFSEQTFDRMALQTLLERFDLLKKWEQAGGKPL